MAMDRLATYLVDHLAGSVSASELVHRLIESDLDSSLVAILRQVEESISRHQAVIRRILNERGSEESRGKNLSAWLGEKLSRPATPVNEGDDFGLLRALEALVLGMRGRVALWQTIEAIVPSHPELRNLDAERLRQEAEAEVQMVDQKRLEVARMALRGWSAMG